jgi:protein-disulfide isomerase
MRIEVIESIGKVRNAIFGNVLEAMKACGIYGKVIVVNDIRTILRYGVKTAPALVVNGIVLFAGQTQTTEEIIHLLQHNISNFT